VVLICGLCGLRSVCLLGKARVADSPSYEPAATSEDDEYKETLRLGALSIWMATGCAWALYAALCADCWCCVAPVGTDFHCWDGCVNTCRPSSVHCCNCFADNCCYPSCAYGWTWTYCSPSDHGTYDSNSCGCWCCSPLSQEEVDARNGLSWRFDGTCDFNCCLPCWCLGMCHACTCACDSTKTAFSCCCVGCCCDGPWHQCSRECCNCPFALNCGWCCGCDGEACLAASGVLSLACLSHWASRIRLPVRQLLTYVWTPSFLVSTTLYIVWRFLVNAGVGWFAPESTPADVFLIVLLASTVPCTIVHLYVRWEEKNRAAIEARRDEMEREAASRKVARRQEAARMEREAASLEAARRQEVARMEREAASREAARRQEAARMEREAASREAARRQEAASREAARRQEAARMEAARQNADLEKLLRSLSGSPDATGKGIDDSIAGWSHALTRVREHLANMEQRQAARQAELESAEHARSDAEAHSRTEATRARQEEASAVDRAKEAERTAASDADAALEQARNAQRGAVREASATGDETASDAVHDAMQPMVDAATQKADKTRREAAERTVSACRAAAEAKETRVAAAAAAEGAAKLEADKKMAAVDAARSEVATASAAVVAAERGLRAAEEADLSAATQAAALFKLKEGDSPSRQVLLEDWRRMEGDLRKVGLTAPLVLEYKAGERCSFWFVRADKLRHFSGKTPPKLQGLRESHPDWLSQHTIDFTKGHQGLYLGSYLAVSHRWEHPTEPDAAGVQFGKIKSHLENNASIQWVWFDYWSMPQGRDKPPAEQVEMAVMLPNINLLYLFCDVLILLDMAYMSRFWTQFEAFLSMRKVTSKGLDSAPVPERRFAIQCIHNAPASFAEALTSMWAQKTAVEALAILEKPDVTVTNQSDKDVQLPKLAALDDLSRRLVAGIVTVSDV